MTRVGFAFTDIVSGKPIYYWRDHKGRLWMAETSRSRFRVRVEEDG